MSRDVLSRLAAIIKSRRHARPEDSHTRRLLDDGPIKPAKKLGEEAVETVIASLGNDRDHLIAESADLIFHLLVLLKSKAISLQDVEAALARRTAMSGLEEKASRKSG